MPLDALCLAAVKEELAGQIAGFKIDKVQQPERDVIILALRGHGSAFRLLISAGSGDMRVHLTKHSYENPASPPMFCMLLRKHLTGARVISISQPPAERVLEFLLEAPDALGVASEKRLVIELIAKSSNVILVDGEGIVIDCLRRVGGDMSEKRSVLPGLIYRRPPAQEGKVNPIDVTGEQWQELFCSKQEDKTAEKWMLSTFSAFSPLICRELVWRAYGDCGVRRDGISDGGDALRREFFAIMDIVKSGGFEAWGIIDADNSPRDFSYTKISQYENAFELRRSESFSEMLDSHYTRTSQLERLRQRASATLKTVKTARDRIARKLASQQAELEKTALRDTLRECGDIITANLHSMKKGMDVLIAQDFYSDDGAVREIRLNPLKTPQQNAAKYYKDYTKAKTAESFLSEQLSIGFREVEYLESVIESISLAEGEKDLDEIRRELVQAGYIRDKRPKGSKVKAPPAVAPMRFVSSSGMQILAGRNNVQNDNLTLKSALKTDVWLHAQKIHGSHVIISCKGAEPDDVTLREAAVIAAYFSAARGSGKVPVDYVAVRSVKRQPGGRPGMVIYTGFKTAVVEPDEKLVARLRV